MGTIVIRIIGLVIIGAIVGFIVRLLWPRTRQ